MLVFRLIVTGISLYVCYFSIVFFLIEMDNFKNVFTFPSAAQYVGNFTRNTSVRSTKYLINISCKVLYKRNIVNMYKISKNVTIIG